MSELCDFVGADAIKDLQIELIRIKINGLLFEWNKK